MPTEASANQPAVLRLADIDAAEMASLLAIFGIQLVRCSDAGPIPGSYWGGEEAGLIANRVYARDDTPLHSILHESSHYICVSPKRRNQLDTDAGSDDAEENAVCYLQVLLADNLAPMGRARMFADMDAWGYSFRLGSSQAWFETDADDALQWLVTQGLVEQNGQLLWRLRDQATANSIRQPA
jgi:hypothetical protein